MKFVHKELKILFTNSLDIFIPFLPGPVADQCPPVPTRTLSGSCMVTRAVLLGYPCQVPQGQHKQQPHENEGGHGHIQTLTHSLLGVLCHCVIFSRSLNPQNVKNV